jgi:hypothetical protein
VDSDMKDADTVFTSTCTQGLTLVHILAQLEPILSLTVKAPQHMGQKLLTLS